VVRDVIISSPEVIKEVDGFINQKMHKDDFVYFKELFSPENSVYKGMNVTETKFARVFDDLLSSKSDYKEAGNLKEFLVSYNVAVYCPYPAEDYPAGTGALALTSDPVDNEQENLGYEVLDDGTYDEVTVDEEYTQSTPVWIISQEEESSSPVPVTSSSESIYQLRIGWVKATEQYDWLFAGGSEFKFCIIGGDITMTGATSFSSIQTCRITRSQIRHKEWVNFQYELDDDWYVSSDGATDEGARQFGLIEYDPWLTTFTLAFEPKVKIKTLEISVLKLELKITSSDDWIKTDKFLSRENFIKYNKVDMGNGLQDGYRVFAAGSVYWTLPLLEY
ncbi:MAG TPA: hypothetical protein VIK14_15195, partial [Ignavibacteria bacterium]